MAIIPAGAGLHPRAFQPEKTLISMMAMRRKLPSPEVEKGSGQEAIPAMEKPPWPTDPMAMIGNTTEAAKQPEEPWLPALQARLQQLSR